jgi:tRNA (adenine57-N1/adenine58-N1)-methyltransferase
LKGATTNEESNAVPLAQKKRKLLAAAETLDVKQNSSSVMVRPCSTARGHTGYLTFARLRVHGN